MQVAGAQLTSPVQQHCKRQVTSHNTVGNSTVIPPVLVRHSHTANHVVGCGLTKLTGL